MDDQSASGPSAVLQHNISRVAFPSDTEVKLYNDLVDDLDLIRNVYLQNFNK